jgi:hypothetical protein
VLEDGVGAVRTVAADTYKPGTHEALDILADSVGSLTSPRIEARIVERRPHPSRPPRQGTFTLLAIVVDVRLVRDFSGYEDLSTDARTALAALAIEDGHSIAQALTWPGNLTATEAASATGLVSGCLNDVSSAVGTIEFAGGTNGRLVTTHRFTGAVRVTTQTS